MGHKSLGFCDRVRILEINVGLGYNITMTEKRKSRTINGEAVWQCSRCGVWKFCDEYYKDKRTPNGLKSQCKGCHVEGSIRTRSKENKRRLSRESMRRQRAKDIEKYRKRGRLASRKRKPNEKTKARYELNLAIARGDIIKPKECSKCERIDLRIEGHHESYYKPLDVTWLCSECHADRHRLGVVEFEKV